jgi:predicted component of type VI protein secretion system
MSKATSKVTAMIAEILGVAEIAGHIGEGEAAHAAERCLSRIERAVAGHGGRVMESAGQRLVAHFDSPESARQAAEDIQARVAALPPVSGMKLTVRTDVEIMAPAGDPADRRNAAEDAAPPAAGAGKVGVKAAAAAKTPPVTPPAAAPHRPAHGKAHLCVRYRGQAFLLDDKTPFLTLGRDPDCQLVIVDRKASREHGRIEKQHDHYVFIDSSTNGTYVTVGGNSEIMVRRRSVELEADGRLCFGASGTDPNADFAEYEYI